MYSYEEMVYITIMIACVYWFNESLYYLSLLLFEKVLRTIENIKNEHVYVNMLVTVDR